MDFFQVNSKTVQVAYLNCMSMWSATHVYKGILSKLFEKKQFERKEKKGQQAMTLNKLLAEGIEGNEPTKIIILDEIDQFIHDQNFLYNML
jgi:Cdc6-like AAA superfamily ATPase